MRTCQASVSLKSCQDTKAHDSDTPQTTTTNSVTEREGEGKNKRNAFGKIYIFK